MKRIIFIITLLFFITAFVLDAHADTNIINIYDANGNLVTGDGNYYEYNEANQLVKVRQGDQNGAVVAEYFYDYTGQRVKKIENGVTTYYVGQHFEKQVGGADAGDSKYYFADGERVAKKDPAGNVYYYHSDHLGGVNAVTDSAGTVVAKTEYMPFGDVKQGSTGNEKYSYTGKEKDKTDLYYFEARYNSPMFRHFTQADTIEPDISDPQDLNRYSYVGNNPLSYVDYDGHKKKKTYMNKKEKKKLKELEKKLKATKTGKKLLAQLDQIAKEKDIYFEFDNLKDIRGTSGINYVSNSRIPVGSYFIRLDSDLLSQHWIHGTTVLAHEIRHIIDWYKADKQGLCMATYKYETAPEAYKAQEKPAFDAQNAVYKELKKKYDVPMKERRQNWYQWVGTSQYR